MRVSHVYAEYVLTSILFYQELSNGDEDSMSVREVSLRTCYDNSTCCTPLVVMLAKGANPLPAVMRYSKLNIICV